MIDFTEFTKSEYANSTEPYAQLYALKDNPFLHEQTRKQMAEHAKSVGFSGFMTSYKAYVKTMASFGMDSLVENTAEMEGLKGFSEINVGPWAVDAETGAIYKDTEHGPIYACTHFIFPIAIYVDVETGREKVQITWRKRGKWRIEAVDREVLASAGAIVKLSAIGISATSENAKALVQWMADAEDLNEKAIREERSVSRLGYIGDYGFSPYAEGLNYDGNPDYRDIYNSVTTSGSYDIWLKWVKDIRLSPKLAPRVMLAASFASALLEPCSALSFFVHLYGGTGNGKTVALKLSSSVWGNPEGYLRTFNSTSVGLEMLAGFLHNLPLCMDELQIHKTSGGASFDNMIYQLTEGIGKTRGSKSGGLRATTSWKLAILTTGESPIVSTASAGGTVNRVIEIDATDIDHLFDNDTDLVDIIQENYGWAGKEFLQKLQDADFLVIKEVQRTLFRELIARGITDKQAMAGSVLLIADSLANDYIFKDGQIISTDEMAQFLKTNNEVSEHHRAWEWFTGWLATNAHRFNSNNTEFGNELWGKFNGCYVDIIKTVFNKACADAGFNSDTFAKWLKREGKLYKVDGSNTTRKVRLNASGMARCISIKLDEEETTWDDLEA